MRTISSTIKHFAWILIFTHIFLNPLAAQTAVQPQGAGSEASPYLISNWQELYWISQTPESWNKHFLQTADIDLTEAEPSIRDWDENTGWTPIGNSTTSFSGNYNGGGHIINGLYINRPTTNNQAFIGITSSTAEIHNLGIIEAEILGRDYVGIFVGSHSGNISNCFTLGNVFARNYTGGFVGYVNSGSRISNSFSRASVIRSIGMQASFGGFMGYNSLGSITNCYSTGNVSYLTGANPTNKGFVGNVFTGGSFSMSGNYWDTQASGQLTSAGIASGKTTTEMQTQETFINWDFTDIWAIDPQINGGYPYLKGISKNYFFHKHIG